MDNQYQVNVSVIVAHLFGDESANSPTHRSSRFIEEAIELVQTQGMTRTRAKEIVDYVYDREVGVPAQEVGGVCITLAALCQAIGIEMTDAAIEELIRLNKNGPEIVEKNRNKPKSLDSAEGFNKENMMSRNSSATPEEAQKAFDKNRSNERRAANGGKLR